MGETRLTVEKVIAAGIDLDDNTPLLTTETYLVRNDGETFLHFKKSGVGDCVVTIQTPITTGGFAVADQAVTVPASGGDMHCGPYPKRLFNDGNNDLRFTLSDIAGLSVAIGRL